MSADINDQIGLVDLLEFNRQIEGMLHAGIPLSWCGDDPIPVLKQQADRVASQAALRVAQGQSFVEALASIPDVSVRYKAAFFGWFYSDRSPAALEMIKSHAARLTQSRKLWFLNVQLSVVFLLALVVLAVWLSIGKVSLLYNDSHLEAGPLSQFLEMLQSRPLYSLVGGLFALIVWGCALHIAKVRISKVSNVIGAKEAVVHDNWLKSRFIRLVSGERRGLSEAEQLYESLVLKRNKDLGSRGKMGEETARQSIACSDSNEEQPRLVPVNSILWSAEKAIERRLAYRVSILPYTVYFIGSGVVVFGVGLLVFGPLIELLYATFVPGAF